MTNPEEAIDRVLSGLREAEAPAGMETRILRAMEVRNAAEESLAPRRTWTTLRMMLGQGQALRVAGAVCLAGVVALAAILASMRSTGTSARDVRGVAATAALGGLAGAKEVATQRLNLRDTGPVYGTAVALPSSDGGWRLTVAPHTATAGAGATDRSAEGMPSPAEASGIEPAADYDSLALSEMLAPSRPPPPLPMTHQEMLLADVVHHGEPEELDQLKPEVREKQVEIGKAEFHAFFEPLSSIPQPMKDNE